jgi:hypothetical protein
MKRLVFERKQVYTNQRISSCGKRPYSDQLSELTVCLIYRPLFNGNNSLDINFFSRKGFPFMTENILSRLLSISHLIILVKRSCWKECLCMKINTFNKVLNKLSLSLGLLPLSLSHTHATILEQSWEPSGDVETFALKIMQLNPHQSEAIKNCVTSHLKTLNIIITFCHTLFFFNFVFNSQKCTYFWHFKNVIRKYDKKFISTSRSHTHFMKLWSNTFQNNYFKLLMW